ncbi:MAG: condensation domain-containing protein, partial [Cyanobacteria bacterium P01_A01_bin.83]
MANIINDNLNVINFLQDLQTQGVELWVEGDKLKYRSTKEVLTSQVLSQIKQYKSEILDLLRQNAEPTEPYPLSLGQQALWFLYQLAPESTAYNIMYAVRLKPNIDTAILEQAFTKTIARHPSLRSIYKTEDGQPVQQVCQDLPVQGRPNAFGRCLNVVQFKVTQTSDLSQDYLDNWLAENADRPFKLEQGDLIRAHVLNRSDQTDSIENQESFLLLVAHHIAIDFWSLDILIDDLCLLYQSIEQGNSISLPPLTVQYRDYVSQEQKKLASPELEQQWDYWQQKLAGELPVLNLPTDKPRPPIQTYNGVSHYFSLNEELSQGIRELAKKTGATPYATVLAAFQVLLLRYTSQSEIVLGCPMAGRIDPTLEKIVGYFVNPVVLRGNLAGNPTFEELISKTRQTLFEALDYQELPFPLLVEKLQPERDPSRSPLFQAALVWDRS